MYAADESRVFVVDQHVVIAVQMVLKVVYHFGVPSRMPLVLSQFSTEVTHSNTSILSFLT